MPKNIVLCCDGTANEFASDRTNVVKLYSTLLQSPRQIAFYHPGLGTMEPPGALTGIARRATKLAGRAFGYGFSNDIRDAYVFLMNHFEPGDKVFMFGFSRGAYTVRAVASVLRLYGLIDKGNEPLVPYAVRMLTGINDIDEDPVPRRPAGHITTRTQLWNYFKVAAQFRRTFSARHCKPYFVGIWDAVSSVGWIRNPVRLPYTANNPDIEIARHAVSIDERRTFFRPNLWRPAERNRQSGPKDLRQVWFPGVHCDVGGGYPEAQSGLSKIALEWMIREAEHAGLLLDERRVNRVLGRAGGGYVQPCPNGPMHQSLEGAWRLAEFVLKEHYDWKQKRVRRRINLFRRRFIPPNSRVHDAAYDRSGDYSARLPTDAIRTSTRPPLPLGN